MNNKPVAYGRYIENAKMWLVVELNADMPEGYIPLYIHPSEHDLGIAEAIGFEKGHKSAEAMLRQQQAELDRAVELYTDKAIENEALKELLANEGIVVGHDYLNNCIATMRKAQEKC